MSESLSSAAPRLGDRSLFSQLRAVAYLNHAAISPASDPVRRAVQTALEDVQQKGSAAFGARLAEREQLRSDLARLLNADREEIALVPSTMYGLAAIATSLPWRAGERVIVFTGEYPTNVSVWQRACERFALRLTALPADDFARPEGPDLQPLERELARGGVRLVAVSAVQFQTGLRMPLGAIGALCHEHGAELAVDAVQALGCVPIDVRALAIDYLAAGSHKWLLGIDGAGVLFARRELAARFEPLIVGAMSHVDALAMFERSGQLRYDRALRPDVRVFEGGMQSSLSGAALGASVPILLALGPAAIHRHVNDYLDRLEPALVERGFSSLRASDPARRSGILSLLPPERTDPVRLASALGARGITCASPDGVLRLAPHFANSFDEVPRVLAAIDAALGA